MKLRRRLRQAPEIAFALGGFLLFPWLPRRALVSVADRLGDAAWALCARERRLAEANVEVAFGSSHAPDARRAIVRASFRNAARVALDLYWFAFFSRQRLDRWVRLDASARAFVGPGAHIGVAAHFGNWEVLGLKIAQAQGAMTTVVSRLENHVADRVLTWLRSRTGQTIVHRRGAVRHLVSTLRAGGSVALVLDQNTPPEAGGDFVAFLGLPATMSRSAAALAIRQSAVCAFLYAVPEPGGRYAVHASALRKADPSTDSERDLTAWLAGRMEEAIRKHPGAWLWMYKRWKHIPPGADPGAFPFYAKPWKPLENERRSDLDVNL
jgi:KDO2-lipid IV(A) lauroyltransferase